MAVPGAARARRAGRVRVPRAAHARARVHAAVRAFGRRGHRRRREADVHVRRPRRPLGQPAAGGDGVGGARVHRDRALERRAGDALVLHRADVPARTRAARAPAPVPPDRRRGVRRRRAVAGRRDDRDDGDDARAVRAAGEQPGRHGQLAGRARGARRVPRHAGDVLQRARRQAGRRFAAAADHQPAAHPGFEEPRRHRGRRRRPQPARFAGRGIARPLRARARAADRRSASNTTSTRGWCAASTTTPGRSSR